jgi:hypothetical protein
MSFMNLALLRQSLTDLRRRFENLRGTDQLRLILTEGPGVCRGANDPRSDLSFVQGRQVIFPQCYRPPVIRVDDAGRPTPAEVPFFDVLGEVQRGSDGQLEYYEDCGAFRDIWIEGTYEKWQQFRLVAADAGHVFGHAHMAVRKHFPRETLELTDPVLRWLSAIFDLAWAGSVPRHRLTAWATPRAPGRMQPHPTARPHGKYSSLPRGALPTRLNDLYRGDSRNPRWSVCGVLVTSSPAANRRKGARQELLLAFQCRHHAPRDVMSSRRSVTTTLDATLIDSLALSQ